MKSNLTLLLFLQLLLALECVAKPSETKARKCGYDSCPKPTPGLINVHVVTHTHDDLGWLLTVDEYFYGSGENDNTSVQLILDSVVAALAKNSKRRFVYAETGFFWMWWQRQSKKSKTRVKQLVDEGRLEFVGGGWAMHDEAVTHYQSLVDQMSLGFRHLDNAFGECGRPRVGWQIDSFGHSCESASLMARFGFDGLFFTRVDANEKYERALRLNLEMIWETSAGIGADADLFTSILNEYNSPDEFCFDKKCYTPVHFIEDKTSEDYNAEYMAFQFIDKMEELAMSRKSKHILFPMGGDFHFQQGEEHIATLEKLMNTVNKLHRNITVFFSTPSCYLKAVNDEQLMFPVQTKDFFPYYDWDYWSGYYSSRPALKYFERIGNNFLQISKQLFTLAQLDKKEISKLNSLRKSMAVLQHHDAVTGTEKQAVAFDYAAQLFRGLTDCAALTSSALRKLIINTSSSARSQSELSLQPCWLLNISSCNITETYDTFVVTLYNPLSRMVSRHVRIPVQGDSSNYVVMDALGRRREVQIVPIPEHVLAVPGRVSSATVELVFFASGIPALGFKSYHVTTEISDEEYPEEYEYVSVSEVEEVEDQSILLNGVKVEQHFLKYSSDSGAYIFRPVDFATVISSKPASKSYKGPLVDEIHMVYNDWLTQVIRSYKGSSIVEYNWMVGPIPESNFGQEIITRYKFSDVTSNSSFYTDSNGREMVKRIRKPIGYKYLKGIPQNYYPITTRVMIKDNKTQVAVITDRSQGCSSLNDKQIEIMLHRRLADDDHKGVGEPLKEEAFGTGLVVRGTHYVTSGEPSEQSAVDRMLVQEKVLGAWAFFTPTAMTFKQWKRAYNMKYSGLKTTLPPNVQILTLEPWKQDSYLIRLEHIMEPNDNPTLSEPVIVDIEDIFVPFKITSIKETTLGGIQWRKDMKRLVWIKEGGNRTSDGSEDFEEVNPSSVRLQAMEIRSFVVHLKF